MVINSFGLFLIWRTIGRWSTSVTKGGSWLYKQVQLPQFRFFKWNRKIHWRKWGSDINISQVPVRIRSSRLTKTSLTQEMRTRQSDRKIIHNAKLLNYRAHYRNCYTRQAKKCAVKLQCKKNNVNIK